MAMFSHRDSRSRAGFQRRLFIESLEDRQLLAVVTLDLSTIFQTIEGWGTAAVYPTNLVTVAQAGAIMRDAGMNVVRVTPSANDYTYTVGGSMSTPVPISANLDENVTRFNPGANSQVDLINWLQVNALQPDRTIMIGALWSPPHWMKITTGSLISWDGGASSGYDPVLPWGDYGANTGAGRVNPTMWTDWARYVLSTVESWEQKTGLPMYAFSFQNEPNVPTSYNSCTFDILANDVNNPSAGGTQGHWELYGDGVQALANELALHPEITTKFFGPELSQLGGGSSLTSCNPYNLGNYNAVRQNLISRGLLDDLDGWATHEYTNASGGDAALWDAWYNGSAHAALIVSNGTSNYLDWLGPTPGVAGDNKEIWQTETEGEDQTWTKDGAMSFGLKIQNALVYGHVSGYTSWTLTGYSSSDTWGLVDLDDINNPTNSYKYDAMKQFSRYISSGAERINAVFENGKASIGGANELDTYNGLTVSAFNQAQDKRLTMVFTNMETSSQSTTITIPTGLNVSSFQVFVTSGTQKFVQLADLIPSGGQITITIPASSFVTITGLYGTPDPVAPAAPTGLSGTVVTNRRIDLSWTDNASNETAFFMERATNSGFTQNLAITTLSTNATSYHDTAVVPSTTYYYRVRAYNAAGYSAYSNVVNYTTTAAALPAAPTNLSGTVVSNSRIDLSWTDNANNETSFYIQRATNSGFTQNLVTNSVGSNVTSYQSTGLSASTTYYYRVRASNLDGYSSYTNVVNYTTLASTSIFTSNLDIGSPSPTGSGSYTSSSDTYTVAGGGADIWGSSDQFHFLSQSFTSNGTIIARVDSVQNTNVSAKGGVMFRDSTATNAAYAFAWVKPNGNVVFETRSANGVSSSYSSTVSGTSIPVWVRVIRSGNQFTASYSSNGTSWTQVGTTQLVTMVTNAQVGLAVTSHINGTLCTSVFSNVSVTAPDTTPPTVTINQTTGQADPANGSLINYTVVFSESVSDFATGDVTLSGTAGATTAVVTGSGTTYNVAVSGMTVDGTIIASLLAGVAHDAASNASTASTSTDNTVTLYTPTHTWDGGGANYYLSTRQNWTNDIAPLPGDSLIFPGVITPEPHIITNTFNSGTVFASITFSGTGYQLSGNSFAVSGGIQLNSVTLTIDVGTAATMQIDGSIGGTGEIIKTGAGELILYGTGYYGLDTTVVEGKLSMGRIGTVSQPVSIVEVQADARLEAAGVFTDTLNVASGGKLTIRRLSATPLPPAMPQAPSQQSLTVENSVLAAATPTASQPTSEVVSSASTIIESPISSAVVNSVALNDVSPILIANIAVPTSLYREKTVINPVAAVQTSPAGSIANPQSSEINRQIYDFLFNQVEKLVLPSAAVSMWTSNGSSGSLPISGLEKTRKISPRSTNQWQNTFLPQVAFAQETARDTVLQQSSDKDWRTDWDSIDELEKKVKLGVRS